MRFTGANLWHLDEPKHGRVVPGPRRLAAVDQEQIPGEGALRAHAGDRVKVGASELVWGANVWRERRGSKPIPHSRRVIPRCASKRLYSHLRQPKAQHHAAMCAFFVMHCHAIPETCQLRAERL